MYNELIKIYITLKAGKSKIENIYSEIRLPENDQDEIYISAYPTNTQLKKILGKHTFKISAVAFDDSCFFDKIIIEKAILKRFTQCDNIKGSKTNLLVFHCLDFYGEYENKSNVQKNMIEGWYFISLLASLSPNKTLEPHSSGSISIRPYNAYKFNLTDKFRILFDTKYFYKTKIEYDEQKVDSCKIKNVAEFNSSIKFEDIGTNSKFLDDFLMLLSFAIRKRTVCTGWSANNGKKIIYYLKRNVTIPEYTDTNLFPNYLIEPSELENFLEHSYNKLYSLKFIGIIRRAIFPITSDTEKSTEPFFLLLFSCIESILLHFKKIKNLELIIDEDDFKKIRKNFEKSIKRVFNEENIDKNENIINKYDSQRKKMVYEKIAELNRPSFKTILNKFCIEYNLSFDDLWPITHTEKGICLVEIRNKLIHGGVFNKSHHYSIMVALQHLRIIVERMILKILEWDLQKTRVAKSKIYNNIITREDIFKHMKILSN